MLSFIDVFNASFEDSKKDLFGSESEFFEGIIFQHPWAQNYELDTAEYQKTYFQKFDVIQTLNQFDRSLSLEEKVKKLHVHLDVNLEQQYSNIAVERAQNFKLSLMSMSLPAIFSSFSLMTYGYYINDMIKIAREHKNPKIADKSLLNAIRIDPSAICCPTATNRLSKAVIFNDEVFIKNLKNALLGKIGARESKSYQKMRFILQALHENGGINLTDSELNDLFVNQLKLYSDSQKTSAKNLSEFTRKFKAQKSTI